MFEGIPDWVLVTVLPVIVGVVLGCLSLPFSLIGGAIWKTASPHRIGSITGAIMPVPIVLFYSAILLSDLRAPSGVTSSVGAVIADFVPVCISLIILVAVSVFVARKLAGAVMQNRMPG
jgi:hypothetical protein